MGATLSRVDGVDLTEKMTHEQRSEGGEGVPIACLKALIYISPWALAWLASGSPLFDFMCLATVGWGLAQTVLTKDTHS